MKKHKKLPSRKKPLTARAKTVIYIAGGLVFLLLGFFSAKIMLPVIENMDPPAVSSSPSGTQEPFSSVTISYDVEYIKRDVCSRAVYIPPSKLINPEDINEVISLCKGSDINTVIVDIKDDTGLLHYETSYPDAKNKKLVSDTPINYQSLIRRLNQNDIYVTGRIVCFKDNLSVKTPEFKTMSVLTHSGVRWYYSGFFWMDPFKDGARQYIYSIVKEAAAMGFNEIMLDEAKFVDRGPTDMLDYGPDDTAENRKSTIRDFINEVCRIAHASDVKVSLKISPQGAYDGKTSDESGQVFDYSELDIDYLSPDFQITSLVSGNYSFSCGNSVIEKPVNNPLLTVSAALEATGLRLQGTDIVLRPLIQCVSPYSVRYTPDDIVNQAKLCKYKDGFTFIFWDSSGVYSQDILSGYMS